MTIDADIDPIDDDDTTGLDRGDEVVDNDDNDDSGDGTGKQPRGKDGKFAKADAADDDADDADDDDKGKGKVPNAAVRLDKLRKQRDDARIAARQLEERLAALEAAAKAGTDAGASEKFDPVAELNTKLDELYEQVEELRADGNAKEAAKVQREIDAANREILRIEAEQISAKTTTQAAEDARYDALLDQLEADIEVINPQHEDFDPKAVKALEWYTAAFEKNGMKPSQALKHAAKMLFDFGAPKKAEPDAKKDDKVTSIRRKTDVNKALDTQKRQPPDAANRGVDKDETRLDPDNIPDEDWDKLPKAKKAAMRGDHG